MAKITNALYKYDIYPKVFRVGRTSSLTLKILEPSFDFSGGNALFKLAVSPINAGPCKGDDLLSKAFPITPVDRRTICFEYTFDSEQEYQIRVYKKQENGVFKQMILLSVYALLDDLADRIPLLGDFHAHSCCSDGKDAPEYVAANYRRHAFDFMTLTDHRRYQPSVIAHTAFEGIPTAFRVYRGEEIHTPGNPVHLVNFASDFSVNNEALLKNSLADWSNSEGKPEWAEAVDKVEAELSPLPDGINGHIAASCVHVARRVRAGGGMCILAHPHWISNVRNVSDAFTEYILKNNYADALELLGGQSCYENQTQVALYNELRVKGYDIPIVGSSDEHGTLNIHCGDASAQYSMFTEEQTVVFAKSNTRNDIIEAVKGHYSTAVEEYVGQYPHFYGEYRTLQYTAFLWYNYFPLRAELCAAEGRFIIDYLSGNTERLSDIEYTAKKLAEFEQKYFSL